MTRRARYLHTISLSAGVGLSVLSATTLAAPFGAYDARSAGMGNVGVAAGTLAGAPFFNPALLTAQKHDDDFALVLPTAGAHIADTQGLIDDVDAFQTAYNAGDTAAMSAILNRASGKTVLAEAHGGTSLAMAGEENAFALSLIGHGYSSLRVLADTTTPQNSQLQFRELELYEAGLSLAHRFDIGDLPVSVGVTPKRVTAKTHDYEKPLTTASTNVSDFFNGSVETRQGTGNVDAGIVFGRGPGWRLGVVGRNLQKKEFVTTTGAIIEVKPQARAGLAYSNNWFTLAGDVDLTENQPVAFEEKTKMAAVGLELNAWDLVQFRAGWQHNLAVDGTTTTSNGTMVKKDLYSLGLGLSPVGVHLDIAAMTNSNKNDVGAFAQMSVQF
jgi:hypothetical protein